MKRIIAAAIVGGVLAGLSQGAGASGFAIREQGVSDLGTAFAGASAVAQDATTVFFNPAGMTRLEGSHFTLGSHLIVPSAEFADGGSRSVLGLPPGGALAYDAGDEGVVPNVYFVTDVGDQLKFGLGITAPFALATRYDRNWVGRYHAVDSEVMAVNVGPTLAWQVTDYLALGAGIDLQYLEATLSNAIDYGTLDAVAMGGAFGLTPGASDGFGEISGSDVSWGWNLGALIDLSDTTRLGLHYRSKIDFRLRGDADFTNPAGAALLAQGLGFVDTGAVADLTTPDSLSVSLHHQFNDRWAVMADVTRTGWDVLDEIRIQFDNGAADSVTTMQWDDSWRVALGVSYAPNRTWIWRAGIAYDQTPIPNAELRTPRIPGEDRSWLTFGFGYRVNQNLSVDVGYAHLWFDDPRINKVPTALPGLDENSFRGALVGQYAADVDILSAQLNWAF